MDYRHVLQRDTVLDGKYRIERVIGAGGFGITYEALDLGLETHVAVKEYYPAHIAMRDTTLTVRPGNSQDRPLFDHLRSSFLREARTLARFQHTSIVGVLNVFEWHGTAYMVMKLERGPSLKTWLADLGRPATQAELDAIAGPVLDALEVMHAADFLHRDIAPDNIIIRDNGSPIILDFGASRRIMGAGQVALTGVVKQGYSPQEQYASDARSHGPWTDIYATAATLYLAVVGTPPQDTTERMLEDHMPTAVSAARAGGWRPQFLEAIDWGMSLRPKERPQSIAEWRQAIFGTETANAAGVASRSVPVAAPAAGTQATSTASSPRPSSAIDTAVEDRRSFPRALSPPSSPSSPVRTVQWPSRAALLALAVGLAVTIGGMVAFGFGFFGRRPAIVAPAATSGLPAPGPREPSATKSAAASQAEADRLAREAAAASARQAAAPKSIEGQRSADTATSGAGPNASAAAQTVLVANIRRELNRVGCRTEASAPGWVDADQRALQRFVRYAGGNITFAALNTDIVETVGTYVGRVCPSQCGPGEKPEVASCVAAAAPAASDVPSCSQINERAQLGNLTEDERQRLRTGQCR